MDNGYTKRIRERVLSLEDGTVFVTSDFADIADTSTIRQSLSRLVQSGTLRRILKGVYEKPKYSKLLDEYVAADPEAVATALARSYHWTIAPCGNTALNLLGLSTQVTAVWSYISDGPYKTYEWNSTKLEFKHRTNKEITGLSYIAAACFHLIFFEQSFNNPPIGKNKSIFNRFSSRSIKSCSKITLLHDQNGSNSYILFPGVRVNTVDAKTILKKIYNATPAKN